MSDNQLETLLNISHKNLVGTHPILAHKVLELVRILYEEEGVSFAVHTGLRSRKHQLALYMQGRYSLSAVNDARRHAGLRLLYARENRRKVTSVKFSWHNTGLAADLVEDGDRTKAGIQWSWKSIKSYLKIGKHAKALGLSWGGFWKSFKDYPHVELPIGLSLKEASKLTKPEICKKVREIYGK